jgi:hypothetical protein
MVKFEGRKRQHDADAFMADIAAKRPVRHLERALDASNVRGADFRLRLPYCVRHDVNCGSVASEIERVRTIYCARLGCFRAG